MTYKDPTNYINRIKSTQIVLLCNHQMKLLCIPISILALVHLLWLNKMLITSTSEGLILSKVIITMRTNSNHIPIISPMTRIQRACATLSNTSKRMTHRYTSILLLSILAFSRFTTTLSRNLCRSASVCAGMFAAGCSVVQGVWLIVVIKMITL